MLPVSHVATQGTSPLE